MLSEHKIYHALSEQHQMLGCDRELFMLNLLVAAALIFTALNTFVTIGALILGSLTFMLLRRMGKKDLQMRHVYLRQLRYLPYYRAQAPLLTPPRKRYLK